MKPASSTTVSRYGKAWTACTGTSPMPGSVHALQPDRHRIEKAEQQAGARTRRTGCHLPKIIAASAM